MPAEPGSHRRSRPKTIQHRVRRERRGSARERGYTTQWQHFREAFLLRNPLCGYCLNRDNRVVAASIVDHIIPHRGDPDLFWPEGQPEQHFMSCCAACHGGLKAKAEWMADRFGHDLRPLLVRMGMLNERTGDPLDFPAGETLDIGAAVLIYGPPASGKTSTAQTLPGVIYDLDDVAERLGLPRHGRTVEQTKVAAEARNDALRAHDPAAGQAIIIATCAQPWTVHRWQAATGCDVVAMTVSEAECLARVQQDAARLPHLPAQIRAIRKWFAARS